MSGFQVKLVCAYCRKTSSVFLKEGVKGKVNCWNCRRPLFEFVPVSGYVYILSNPDMPGLVKIGYTTTSVEQRARQVWSTGVPTPFVIEAYFASEMPHIHEQQIHQRLNRVRRDDREFFAISASEAYKVLLTVMRVGPAYVSSNLKRLIEQSANQRPSTGSEPDDDLLNQIKIL